MSFFDAIRYRLRTFFRGASHEQDFEEEFRFHLTLEQQQRRHDGLGTDEAAFASRRRFGNVTHYRQEVRRVSALQVIDTVQRHVRHAIRGLMRTPGFSLAAVMTLALGIGGITAIGTVVNGVLLKPLPYPDPGRLVGVWNVWPEYGAGVSPQSDAAFFTFQQLGRTAEKLGAYLTTDVNLSEPGEPEHLKAAAVSAGFFDVIRPTPLLGRPFGKAEDQPGAAPVVVISEALWRRKFGARHDVLGRVLQIEGRAHQVVGVMSSRLGFPEENVQLWTPLQLDPSNTLPASSSYALIARLRPAVTLDAAQRDFQQALRRMPELYPNAGFGLSTKQFLEIGGGATSVVHPLRDDVIGDIGGVLWVLAGTAAFVLLVACANVATLFLVRAESRQREMAVRIALGAGRSGLVSQFLTEGLLLAGAGAGTGLLLTAAGIRLLTGTAAVEIPRLSEVAIDGASIGLVVVLTLAVGIGCSLLPVSRLKTRLVASVLRSGGRGATGGRDRQRARQTLVVAQVALAFALLAGSGLLARTFLELRSVEPGFDPTKVLTFGLALPAAGYHGASDLARFYQSAAERLSHLPGVRTAGLTSKLPLRAGRGSNNTVLIEDRPTKNLEELAKYNAAIVVVEGDYFRAMGIPLLAGRGLDRTDPGKTLDQVVVNAGLVKRMWDDPTGRIALGRRLRFAPTAPWFTVVGIVGDVRSESLNEPPGPTVYLPPTSPWLAPGSDASPEFRWVAEKIAPRVMNVVLSLSGDPAGVAPAARATIGALDPTLPVFDMVPMSRVLSASMARTTFTGWMLAAAAGISLVLGVIGIYGVVAYTVSLRIREIGLRLALGARPAEVGLMLVRQGMILVGIGIGTGMALTFVITGSLRALLFGVSPNDPVTLGLVALLLVSATLLATLIPARRAGHVDPALTLAGE